MRFKYTPRRVPLPGINDRRAVGVDEEAGARGASGTARGLEDDDDAGTIATSKSKR